MNKVKQVKVLREEGAPWGEITMSQADYQGWLKWAKQDGQDPQGLLAAVCAQQYDWEAPQRSEKTREARIDQLEDKHCRVIDKELREKHIRAVSK